MRYGTQFAAASLLILASASAGYADQLAVAPPPGAPLLLEAKADGVQIYVCEASGEKFAWVFKAPEANLFETQGRQIGTHFAGPSWKTNDGTTIVAEPMAKADAPRSGDILWLLLRVTSHEGTGVLAGAAFVRRADTQGGVAPTTGCDASHVAERARIRYSATYQFYGSAK